MNTLRKLVHFLQENQSRFTRTVRIEDRSAGYDQTYGYPVLEEFTTIDFQEMLDAIDEFAGTFDK